MAGSQAHFCGPETTMLPVTSESPRSACGDLSNNMEATICVDKVSCVWGVVAGCCFSGRQSTEVSDRDPC